MSSDNRSLGAHCDGCARQTREDASDVAGHASHRIAADPPVRIERQPRELRILGLLGLFVSFPIHRAHGHETVEAAICVFMSHIHMPIRGLVEFLLFVFEARYLFVVQLQTRL